MYNVKANSGNGSVVVFRHLKKENINPQSNSWNHQKGQNTKQFYQGPQYGRIIDIKIVIFDQISEILKDKKWCVSESLPVIVRNDDVFVVVVRREDLKEGT